MAYPEETYPDEDALREKMKQWGIIRDEPSYAMIPTLVSLRRFLRTEPTDVIKEIGELKRRVSELERQTGKKRAPAKADYVYDLFKKELEERNFGKVVAIDTESEKIVGIGDTILEAYNEAKERTGKGQFDFRRVGYKYIHKV